MKKTTLRRRFIPSLAVTCALAFSSQTAFAVHAPLYSPVTKICSSKLLAEMDLVLIHIQNQITNNEVVSNTTLTPTHSRPFKIGQDVNCVATNGPSLTTYRCTGKVGTPCGVASNKKFICKFLDSQGSEGFHNNATESNTTSAYIPTHILCNICIPNMPSEITKLSQYHNNHQESGDAVLINDPTGTTCW